MPADGARWGWHRLDSRWITRLVAAADVGRGDLVLDIGAGDGRITEALLERRATVIAVELHPRRAAELRCRFASDRVVVVQADAAQLRLPRRPFKVVANPPFGVTSAVLRRLTAPRSALQCGVLVVPTWAAARWSGGRGVGGETSRRVFASRHGGIVPARAFRPPPPADPAILVIERR